MDELPAAHNVRKAGEGDGAQDHPHYPWDEYFRFRPIGAYQCFKAEIEKRGTAKQQRDYVTDINRRFTLGLLRSKWAGGVLICAAILAMAWVGWASGYFDPNRVIALFTVITAIATGLGWWAMHQQNSIMREQIRQTDTTLEHMRDERRGWLSTSHHKFDHSDLDEPAEIKFQFANSGSSPCTVTEFRLGLGVDADIAKAERDARANLLFRKTTEIGRAVVPPGVATGQTSWPELTLQPHERVAVENGTARYCIAIKFKYSTAGADDCETGQMITYYTADGGIFFCGDHGDNYMK